MQNTTPLITIESQNLLPICLRGPWCLKRRGSVTDHAQIILKTLVNSDITICVPSFADRISFNFQSISTIVYLVLQSCVLFILLCSLLMCFYLCVVSVPNSLYI